MCAGPSRVPIAAKSFTSPAPVAPITCPGSISARPIARPASAPVTLRLVACEPASATPRAAIDRVRTLGTRRVRKSMTVAAPPAKTMTASAIGSDVLSNGLPEHVVDRVPDRRHGGDRDDRDQRHEQTVLEQILPVLTASEPADGDKYAVHDCPR